MLENVIHFTTNYIRLEMSDKLNLIYFPKHITLTNVIFYFVISHVCICDAVYNKIYSIRVVLRCYLYIRYIYFIFIFVIQNLRYAISVLYVPICTDIFRVKRSFFILHMRYTYYTDDLSYINYFCFYMGCEFYFYFWEMQARFWIRNHLSVLAHKYKKFSRIFFFKCSCPFC